MSKKSTIEQACGPEAGPSEYATLNSANTFATISTIAFAAAGAGAGVALVSLILGHSTVSAPAARPPAEALRITPWIGVGTAGLRGAF